MHLHRGRRRSTSARTANRRRRTLRRRLQHRLRTLHLLRILRRGVPEGRYHAWVQFRALGLQSRRSPQDQRRSVDYETATVEELPRRAFSRRRRLRVQRSLSEFHYRWKFDLKSSPERLWPFIADTNRFNRDTGVPQVHVEKEQQRRRNARRKLRLSIYGMPVEWEEQPFEWVKPARFGIERVYNKGPMARLRARAELSEKPDSGG